MQIFSSTAGNVSFYTYDNKGKLIGLKKNKDGYDVHLNLRGDVYLLTSIDGFIEARYNYDPWGNQIYYSGLDSQPFRYAGYYYDEETGLYYLKNRYYSPALGRFLTKDSYSRVRKSNPQSLNQYAYCNNNPVTNVDPNGDSWITAAISAVVSNVVSQSISHSSNSCSNTLLASAGSSTYYWTSARASGVAISSGVAATVSGVGAFFGTLLGFPASLDKDPSEMSTTDDYDEQWDQLYDQNSTDTFRPRDAKKRERREINNSLGKDRAAREDYSREWD